MSAAYFQNAEYKLSGEARREAVDIYRDVVGEEENPMLLTVLLEQLGDAGVNLSELLGGTELSDLLGSEDAQERLLQLTSEDLSSLLGKLAHNKQSQDKQATPERLEYAATDATGQAPDKPDAEKPEHRVHEQLIDIEQIRQNSLNVTSMRGEL